MPRPTTPGPPPASSAAGKPASYLAAQSRASGRFRLRTDFTPQGDQEQAIGKLVAGLNDGRPDQVLLGVTGSGKTFTIAKVIEAVNRPTLVLSHNKTLAAQLYQEFRSFFPENSVEYFVSYYDYYQPEAYVPQTDTYIEKDATRNEEIDKLRLVGVEGPLREARRRGRGVGLLHLRPRRARLLLRHARLPRSRGHARHAGAPRAARRDAVRADEPGPDARDVPRARRRARGRPGVRGHGRPGRVLRRRDREDHAHGSAPRHAAPARRPPRALPANLLRDAAGDAREGDRHDPAGARRPARGADAGRPPARGPAAPPAHDVRPRDDQGAGLLQRHRELLEAPLGAGARRAAADAPGLLPGRLPARRRRVARDASAGAGDVLRRPLAQAGPGRLRLPPAVRAGQSSADLRRVPGARPPGHRGQRHAEQGGARARGRGDRGTGHPPDGPARSA